MSKVKYYYDPDTLSYRKVTSSKLHKYGRVSLLLVAGVILGIMGLLLLLQFNVIITPKELSDQRELKNFELQFEIMNKKLKQIETVLANVEERDNNIYRLYFEVNPIPEEQRKAGFGGVNRYKKYEGFNHSELITNTAKRLDVIKKQLAVQSKSLDEVAKLASEKENFLAAIPAIQPVANKDLTRMASGYGYRLDPFNKVRKMHWGMDFVALRGTPVYASGNGVIKRADNKSAGYGKHIRIDHGYGYISLYAHLSKYNVKRGQHVKRGDIIGFVGSTGRSKGPHLHYEIFKDKQKINPINFYYGSLSPKEFEALLKAANQENQSLD